ncbi:hypothetical protein [Okeania sp. SIO2B3]|uniref:hypothetical protein n=1 Tax=Okeania sp. SIO2B3 TaxID=2607784 RepID=UPI0013BFFDCE|nr:hypothetical protein [Okeania sp. SIO2B3]NET43861.1 hypothetical protein [Okeania sp. SIO2B3]
MMKLTLEQIENLRSELADNAEALEALEVIEECDGDLADAAESIATRNGIQGVQDNKDLRWFTSILQQCRDYICQENYQTLREKYFPRFIPIIADFLAGLLGCPPIVAGLIATPLAVYIQEEGIEKFCKSYESNT